MIEWEWDPEKDRLNRLNHRDLGLAAGAVVFADPLAVSRPDPGRNAVAKIGSAGGIAVLFVVHTEPVEQANGRIVGRIISVRKATRHERKAYEDGTF